MDLSRLKTTRSIANLKQGRNDWYRVIKAQAPDAATQVMVYDEIGWFGVTAQDFINEMKDVSGPVDLHLNSPGGEVFDGLAIYQYLAGRGDVTTYVDSLAASIASVIAMAGTEIVIGKNASVMIHDGFGLCIGNAADMREQADLLDRVSDNIASVYADRTGKPKDHWREQMLAETWYFGQEAVDAGLADRVAATPAKTQPAKDESARQAMAAHFDLSVFRNTPAALKNLRNQVPTPPDPPPTPEQPTPEAPAEPDRGFVVPGEPEPAVPQEGQAVDIEWVGASAGDDFMAWLRSNIRIRGAAGASHPFDGNAGHDHGDDGDEPVIDDGVQDKTQARVLGIETMPIENKAIAVHHTATSDESWDGPAAVAAMPAEYADLHYCHAWQSADADSSSHTPGDDDVDDKKLSFKFPHHAKKGAPANLAACRNGKARLAGADIPDADRAGVEAHLQAHLDDADSGDDGDSAKNHTHEQPGDGWAFDHEQFLKAMKGAQL